MREEKRDQNSDEMLLSEIHVPDDERIASGVCFVGQPSVNSRQQMHRYVCGPLSI